MTNLAGWKSDHADELQPKKTTKHTHTHTREKKLMKVKESKVTLAARCCLRYISIQKTKCLDQCFVLLWLNLTTIKIIVGEITKRE